MCGQILHGAWLIRESEEGCGITEVASDFWPHLGITCTTSADADTCIPPSGVFSWLVWVADWAMRFLTLLCCQWEPQNHKKVSFFLQMREVYKYLPDKEEAMVKVKDSEERGNLTGQCPWGGGRGWDPGQGPGPSEASPILTGWRHRMSSWNST